MSFLGSITSLAKDITDPTSLAKDLAGSLLPKGIGTLVGEAAGAAVDFASGRELQALQQGLAALKDLPQFAQSASGLPGNLTHAASPGFEPSAPHGRRGGHIPGWRHHPLNARTPQQPNITINVTINENGAKADAAKNGWKGTPPSTNGATGANSSPGPADASSTQSSSGSNGANGTSSSSAGASSAGASSAGASSSSGSTTPSSSSATSPSGTGSTSAASDSSSKALKDLMGKNNTDFMNAVRTGNIPDEVMNDPKAMMMIQDRMNQISQMNQLMTSMMQAMHQMEMSIIQNVRV